MKIRFSGRLIAPLAVAALVFGACGTSATPSPSTASAAPSTGSSTAGGAIKVGYLPKDIVNQYFAAAKTGVDKAAGELGGTAIQVGPNEAKPDLQIPFITDLTTQKVSAIIISADGKDEVAPALKAAMAAGIKVVGFDSSPAVGAYNVFVNQVDFSGVGVNLADWACELAPSCTGDIAILSAAATATNQNAWIDLMKTTLKLDKYKGLKLVTTVYGDDDATKSTTQAQALLTQYPNLKVIVAPTTVGISTAAQYLSKHKDIAAKVTLTGLGLPSQMKPYVLDGTVEAFALWNPKDLGYLAGYAAASLASGVFDGSAGSKFTAGKLKDYTVLAPSGTTGPSIVLGPPTTFDKTNVSDFNF